MIRASAPGKLMLAGEYAVVERTGPALATAVSSRVTVELNPGGGRWRVSSERMQLNEADPEALPIVAHALKHFQGRLPAGGGHLRVLSDIATGSSKPGFGSSAAVTVATMAALSHLAGEGTPEIGALIDVHRAAQGGKGSGYDVATCLNGGVTLFVPRVGGSGQLRDVAWPVGLHAAVIYTGHGASTTELLDRVAAWRREDPDDMSAHVAPLGRAAAVLAEAWIGGNVARILTGLAEVQEELDTFDRAGEIGICGGGQLQLLGAIEDSGAIGRTSGAGGGDCVWALSDRPEALARAIASAQEQGFVHLDVGLGAPGLQVEGP